MSHLVMSENKVYNKYICLRTIDKKNAWEISTKKYMLEKLVKDYSFKC